LHLRYIFFAFACLPVGQTGNDACKLFGIVKCLILLMLHILNNPNNVIRRLFAAAVNPHNIVLPTNIHFASFQDALNYFNYADILILQTLQKAYTVKGLKKQDDTEGQIYLFDIREDLSKMAVCLGRRIERRASPFAY
jgi:hypothetical protein